LANRKCFGHFSFLRRSFKETGEYLTYTTIRKKNTINRWFSSCPSVEVTSVKALNEIAEGAKLVILCAFTPSVRVEADTVLPYYKLVSENIKCKAMCVVFRYGESAAEAKITDPNKHSDQEVLSCYPIYFENNGWIKNETNQKTLLAISQFIGPS